MSYYTYTEDGSVHKLEDGLTQEQADAQIKSILDSLETQDKEEETQDKEKSLFSGVKKFLPTFKEGDLSKEIPEAVVSGLSKAVQGTIQTVAMIDSLKNMRAYRDEETNKIKFIGLGIADVYAATTGSNIYSDIDNAFEETRKAIGIDPEGTAAEVTEVVTQLGVPGVAVASKIGTAMSNSGRFARGIAQIAGAGAIDAVVATDDITTIGDFFEGGPTQTDQEIGDDNMEETLRRFTNKLKIGAEGGVATFASPIVTKPAGLLIKGTAKGVGAAADVTAGALMKSVKVTTPNGKYVVDLNPIKALARGAREGVIKPLTNYLDEIDLRLTKTKAELEAEGITKAPFEGMSRSIAKGFSYLRYRGLLSQEIAEKRAGISPEIDSAVKNATYRLDSLETKIDEAIEEYTSTASNLGRTENTDLTAKEIFNKIQEMLTNPLFSLSNRTKGSLPKTLDEVYKKHIKSLPIPMQKIISAGFDDMVAIRTQIDNLSRNIADSDFIKTLDNIRPADDVETTVGEILRNTIKHQMSSYMRRSYRLFNERNYKPTKEIMAAAINGFKADKKSTTKELVAKAKDLIQAGGEASDIYARLGLDETGQKISAQSVNENQAKQAAEYFLQRMKGKEKGTAKAFGRFIPTRQVAEYKLSTDILKNQSKLKAYQRDLMGEIKNPRQNILSTISELAEFKAVDDYYGFIRNLAKANPDGFGKIFKDVNDFTPAALRRERDSGRVIIGKPQGSSAEANENVIDVLSEGAGSASKNFKDIMNSLSSSGYGSLNGYSVHPEILNNLSRTILADQGVGAVLNSVWSNILRGQAITEYAKTILSPITQIRNVTSASLTALANGNIGKGANLTESVKITLNDIFVKQPTADTAKYLEKIQKLGVIGSQAELRELQDLIRKGLDVTDDKSIEFGADFAKRAAGYIPTWLKSANKKAQDLYQGGDNVWKIYGFEFEKNKLRNAFRNMSKEDAINYLSRNKTIKKAGQPIDDTIGPPKPRENEVDEVFERLLDEEAADIVRNTIPNYNLVPTAVKTIRKLPTGNFVSFPAEILRTSTNILVRSIDEMLSDNPEISKIGLRRFAGFASATYIVPEAIRNYGHLATDIPRDVIDAYQRSFAPDWEKNSILVPLPFSEDGKLRYTNLSYSLFYDGLRQPITAAINAGERAKKEGKNTTEAIGKAVLDGVFTQLEPFFVDKIVVEKLMDVLVRDGKRKTGAKVWNPGDPWGTKVKKGFNHVVLDSILPGFMPIEVKGGEIFASPVARSIVNKLNLNEKLNMSERDKLNREVKLTDQLIKSFTGVRPIEVDLNESIYFKGAEWQRNNTDKKGVLNTIADDGTLTVNQLINAFKTSNEEKYKNDNKFHLVIQDAIKLGLSKSKIKKILKQEGVYGFDDILKNRFKPFEISDEKLDEMRRKDLYGIYRRARPELNKLFRQFKKLKYSDKDVEFEPISDIVSSIVPEAGAAEIDSTPIITIRPSDKDPNYVPPPVNVPPPSPASSVGEINPLLVPNPTTRATFGSQ